MNNLDSSTSSRGEKEWIRHSHFQKRYPDPKMAKEMDQRRELSRERGKMHFSLGCLFTLEFCETGLKGVKLDLFAERNLSVGICKSILERQC